MFELGEGRKSSAADFAQFGARAAQYASLLRPTRLRRPCRQMCRRINRNPDYQPAFDMDGPQAVATRRKLYDQLATDKMMTQGFHLPFPSVGYIEKDGNGYRFVPVPWNPTI